MDELLARLSNLSYEFFGIVLPGVVAWFFLAIWWACLGPVGPFLTVNALPQITFAGISQFIDSLSFAMTIVVAVPTVANIYFVGHFLHWSARSGKSPQADNGPQTRIRRLLCFWRPKPEKVIEPVGPTGTGAKEPNRTWRSLCFQIPKPKDSFDPKLQPLFEFVQDEFACGTNRVAWPQLFPVLKSYLSRNLKHSLVSTYQNKYTLHRAITAAFAAWFWLCAVSLPVVIAIGHFGGPHANYAPLAACIIIALLFVRRFSDSYLFHWMNFGNTVVTETYSLLRKQSDEDSKK